MYCRRAYGFNTHSLRYAFMSYLLKRGVSPSIVAKITGHRSLDHILHYTEVRLAEEVLAGLRGPWGAVFHKLVENDGCSLEAPCCAQTCAYD